MRKTFDAELQELNYEMIDMAAAAEDLRRRRGGQVRRGDDPQHGPDGAGH